MLYPNTDTMSQPNALQQLLTQQLAAQLQQLPYAPQAQQSQNWQQAFPSQQAFPLQQGFPSQQAMPWQQPQLHQSRVLGSQALHQIAQCLQILAHHLTQFAAQQLLAQQPQQAPSSAQSFGFQQPAPTATQPYASGPAVH